MSGGQLYFYKSAEACDAAAGFTSPQDFHSTGSVMTGVLCPIAVQDTGMAGQPGYDVEGYLNGETLRATAIAAGAFAFSRPADVATDPKQPNRFAFTSTGRGSDFAADDWGDLYVVTTDLATMTASVRIVYDGDDSGGGRFPTLTTASAVPTMSCGGQGG